MKQPKTIIPFAAAVVVMLAVGLTLVLREKSDDAQTTTQSPAKPAIPLSRLADAPDWSTLDPWQGSITREDFVSELDAVFTTSGAWQQWFQLDDSGVAIDTGIDAQPYHLAFAAEPDARHDAQRARHWRRADEMEATAPERPLAGVRIAIDPGHIGGQWAKIEARWFQIGDDDPVHEGSMTLLVAKKLKPQLEALGAEVILVRKSNEPVTADRPASFLSLAKKEDPNASQKLAETLFYRTAEIRARAEKVNQSIVPDLVLCLHFNAASWGDPENPRLVANNHLHLITHGAYMDGELAYADHRYHLTKHLVTRIHDTEKTLASSVVQAFLELNELPPYRYEPFSRRAVMIDDNPYLWARNLLANRLYHAPVVFLEPYVMNSHEDYARIQAGDYAGTRFIADKHRPSIFQEYADAVTMGLKQHYLAARPIQPTTQSDPASDS